MANLTGSKQYFQSSGLNLYSNPISLDGALVFSSNVVSFPYGAKTKRTGFSSFLGTPDSSSVQNLIDYHQNDGTTFYLYRKSSTKVYYSAQGTGAWTTAGNGTVNASAYIGNAILDNTLIIGDGVGSTRHTANGTAFTNTSLAPISPFFAQYQNRIYASGTANTLFYSTTNDATNWNTSGTSDSSSFKIPGAGKNSALFVTGNRLIQTKNSGLMFKWDGYALVDMSTKYGPSSPYSIGEAEDYRFYINNFGHYGFSGGKPQLLSNAIQRQFYNNQSTGIVGSVFGTASGIVHIYDYFVSVGSVTDDFTNRTMTNCVINYNFQKNEYLNWDLAVKPTSWLSYKDANLTQQLIFGDSSGQCYKFDNSTSDNGTAIVAEMLFVFTYGLPEYDKKWNWWRGYFNPGCQAKVQIACTDTYTYSALNWVDLGDTSDGIAEYRFPAGSRSKLLLVKIYESSVNSRFTFFGQSIYAQPQIQT